MHTENEDSVVVVTDADLGLDRIDPVQIPTDSSSGGGKDDQSEDVKVVHAERPSMIAVIGRAGSWASSMSKYNMRRMIMEQAVDEGGVIAEIPSTTEVDAHVTKQGDLTMYTEENQFKRSCLKRSKVMRELASKVFVLVADGKSSMNKSDHAVMVTKFHMLVVPPGGSENMEQLIEEDWARDAQKKDSLDFEAFFAVRLCTNHSDCTLASLRLLLNSNQK